MSEANLGHGSLPYGQVETPSDRALIIAAIGAICTLAERLTGERMILRVRNEAGHEFVMHGVNYEWEPIPTLSDLMESPIVR